MKREVTPLIGDAHGTRFDYGDFVVSDRWHPTLVGWFVSRRLRGIHQGWRWKIGRNVNMQKIDNPPVYFPER